MSRKQYGSELPSLPIRFGILDSVAAMVLFGIHLSVFKSILSDKLTTRGEVDPGRLAAAAFLCAAFAFGAAYLAFRLATSKKIAKYRWRLLALLVIDAGLLTVPLLLYLLSQFENGLGVATPLILLALLFWTMVHQIGRKEP